MGRRKRYPSDEPWSGFDTISSSPAAGTAPRLGPGISQFSDRDVSRHVGPAHPQAQWKIAPRTGSRHGSRTTPTSMNSHVRAHFAAQKTLRSQRRSRRFKSAHLHQCLWPARRLQPDRSWTKVRPDGPGHDSYRSGPDRREEAGWPVAGAVCSPWWSRPWTSTTTDSCSSRWTPRDPGEGLRPRLGRRAGAEAPGGGSAGAAQRADGEGEGFGGTTWPSDRTPSGLPTVSVGFPLGVQGRSVTTGRSGHHEMAAKARRSFSARAGVVAAQAMRPWRWARKSGWP